MKFVELEKYLWKDEELTFDSFGHIEYEVSTKVVLTFENMEIVTGVQLVETDEGGYHVLVALDSECEDMKYDLDEDIDIQVLWKVNP